MPRLSRAAWLYMAIVVLAAASVFVHVLVPGLDWDVDWDPTAGLAQILLVLAILFLICDSTPATLTSRQSAWSPSSSAALAAVVLLGPGGAAAVGAMSLLSLRRGGLRERAFNGAMNALSAFAAGEAYLALGGQVGVPKPGWFPAAVLPFAVAAAVHVAVNHGLLWGMLLLLPPPGPGPQRGRLDRHLPLLLASDLGYATLGLLIAALWDLVGPFAAVLVLVPLFVARWAMGQFAAQEAAYSATMAALCQAVETKDLYTRGHSERVSRGATMLAREIGMGAERVAAIRYAGMLHDVGKLGVPTTVLQKTGPLTEEELAAIQLHPMRGLEIVRQIGFLTEALDGIMHHHERVDGQGYPMGLAGDEIPEFARVIAVADAFDSMTSARSYRGARRIGEAVAELRKWSGSQFDPVLVDAFITALHREGWESHPAGLPAGFSGQVAAQDHDDPTAPLRVVESR
ncbi:MAG TPA: HD-GYP domain-containing protein [Streptosporangiaceae bacterium]|nr:HD-GYP domain-containing protein [Streptosporangiaceae bacterium]